MTRSHVRLRCLAVALAAGFCIGSSAWGRDPLEIESPITEVSAAGRIYHVFRSLLDAKDWYYLPSQPRLKESADGVPDFALVRYQRQDPKNRGNIVEGATLHFVLDLTLSDSEAAEVKKAIAAKMAGLRASEIILLPLPLDSADVAIYLQGEKLSNDAELVAYDGQTQGIASSFVASGIPFACALEKEASDVLASLLDGVTGLRVLVRCQYNSATPRSDTVVQISSATSRKSLRSAADVNTKLLEVGTYRGASKEAIASVKSYLKQNNVLKVSHKGKTGMSVDDLEPNLLKAVVNVISQQTVEEEWPPRALPSLGSSARGGSRPTTSASHVLSSTSPRVRTSQPKYDGASKMRPPSSGNGGRKGSRKKRSSSLDLPDGLPAPSQLRSVHMKRGIARYLKGTASSSVKGRSAKSAGGDTKEETTLDFNDRVYVTQNALVDGFIGIKEYSEEIRKTLVSTEPNLVWSHSYFVLPAVGDDPELGVEKVSIEVTMREGSKAKRAKKRSDGSNTQNAIWRPGTRWSVDGKSCNILKFSLAHIDEDARRSISFEVATQIFTTGSTPIQASYSTDVFFGQSPVAAPLESAAAFVVDMSDLYWEGVDPDSEDNVARAVAELHSGRNRKLRREFEAKDGVVPGEFIWLVGLEEDGSPVALGGEITYTLSRGTVHESKINKEDDWTTAYPWLWISLWDIDTVGGGEWASD